MSDAGGIEPFELRTLADVVLVVMALDAYREGLRRDGLHHELPVVSALRDEAARWLGDFRDRVRVPPLDAGGSTPAPSEDVLANGLSARQAAAALDRSREYVTRLARTKQLPAWRDPASGAWMFDREAVMERARKNAA